MSGAERAKPRGTEHKSGQHTEGQMQLKVPGLHSPSRQNVASKCSQAASIRSMTGNSSAVPAGGRSLAQGNQEPQKSRPTCSLKEAGDQALVTPLEFHSRLPVLHSQNKGSYDAGWFQRQGLRYTEEGGHSDISTQGDRPKATQTPPEGFSLSSCHKLVWLRQKATLGPQQQRGWMDPGEGHWSHDYEGAAGTAKHLSWTSQVRRLGVRRPDTWQSCVMWEKKGLLLPLLIEPSSISCLASSSFPVIWREKDQNHSNKFSREKLSEKLHCTGRRLARAMWQISRSKADRRGDGRTRHRVLSECNRESGEETGEWEAPQNVVAIEKRAENAKEVMWIM